MENAHQIFLHDEPTELQEVSEYEPPEIKLEGADELVSRSAL